MAARSRVALLDPLSLVLFLSLVSSRAYSRIQGLCPLCRVQD